MYLSEPASTASTANPIIAVEPTPQSYLKTWNTMIQPFLFSPMGLIIVGCLAFMIWSSFSSQDAVSNSTDKNAKARAKWAGKRELNAARKLSVKQLNGRARKSATAWIIRPQTLVYPESVLRRRTLKNGQPSSWTPAPELGSVPKETPVKMSGDRFSFKVPKKYEDIYGKRAGSSIKTETIWVPDTQRSTMVVGAPGSGKTFSAIDPMIRSAVEQGYPIVLYDFKYPTQTSTIAWYAEKLGYEVRVFAPGFPESDVLNLLDFLTGDVEKDSALARQLASTLNKNFKLGQSGGGDSFFSDAGDQLVQAVLMLAKQMPHADLMTVQSILSAEELPARLLGSTTLDPWIRTAFAQFLSVASSEKTAASIIGTATLNFTRLMMAKILACCVGKSTLPIDLNGKQMVVFGLDREIRDVVSPIVATAITMLVNQNMFRLGGRKDPLFCVFDELPTIYLDKLVNWENESRSDGFNGVIGFQNKSQLEKIYGKEMSLAIMGGCATKFIFNPGEVESAEYFSKLFGDEEIARKNKSRSTGSGKGGSSYSHSVEVSTRKLVSPEEFTGLPPGSCYMTNPAYSNEKMAYLPRRIAVKLPPWELELAGQIEAGWSKLRPRLIARAAAFQRVPTQEDVLLRNDEFDQAYPIPAPEDEANAPKASEVLAGMF